MALLTADDVLNKKFQSVKFREGYDQIEVDEFLDEVVATIYTLTVENTELKEQLEAANKRVAELSSGAPVAPEPTEPEVVETVTETVAAPEQPEVADIQPAEDPAAATSMLALAQRLHDEYVNDGRDEGKRIVDDARKQGDEIIADANNKRDQILDKLADEQRGLEDSINNLRQFESDYRGAISTHLSDLLDQLKGSSSPEQG